MWTKPRFREGLWVTRTVGAPAIVAAQVVPSPFGSDRDQLRTYRPTATLTDRLLTDLTDQLLTDRLFTDLFLTDCNTYRPAPYRLQHLPIGYLLTGSLLIGYLLTGFLPTALIDWFPTDQLLADQLPIDTDLSIAVSERHLFPKSSYPAGISDAD